MALGLVESQIRILNNQRFERKFYSSKPMPTLLRLYSYVILAIWVMRVAMEIYLRIWFSRKLTSTLKDGHFFASRNRVYYSVRRELCNFYDGCSGVLTFWNRKMFDDSIFSLSSFNVECQGVSKRFSSQRQGWGFIDYVIWSMNFQLYELWSDSGRWIVKISMCLK